MNSVKETIVIKRRRDRIDFPVSNVLKAIALANETFEKFSVVNRDLDLFQILGMRNLSAFIGEVYVACLKNASNGLLEKNPHQDGYPDLLLLDPVGLKAYNSIANKQDKAPFSPFYGGGIEVKATCGSVPTPAQCAKMNVKKPEVGDTRIDLVRGYDWKAHHRETNNLIGIFWDFIQHIPRITALFYSSDLTQDDWGAIVQPHEGGGRTTSVSIMTRAGVRKMAEGCLYCEDDPRVARFLSNYNGLSIASILKGVSEELTLL
jgi:hypothetical protein